MALLEFANKVVIVTGSSAGIGEATAVEFASLGAHVVLTGRNTEKLKLVEKKCLEASNGGGKVLLVTADVTSDADLKRLVESTVVEFGQIDILVNNAGCGMRVSMFDSKAIQAYDTVMNANLRSAYVLTHLAIPHLVKTKGNIVNVSSIAGTKPYGAIPHYAYSMSKSALDMFTMCLALELGPHGVRVNCVKPGVIRTNFMTAMGMSEDVRDKFYEEQEKQAPLRRLGTSEEISHLIVFLTSSKSVNMTGSLIVSDSGALWGRNY